MVVGDWGAECVPNMGCHHQTKSGGPRPPQLGWGRVANEKRFKKFQQTRRMSCGVQMKFYVQIFQRSVLLLSIPTISQFSTARLQ
jgi:hypothetical protein